MRHTAAGMYDAYERFQQKRQQTTQPAEEHAVPVSPPLYPVVRLVPDAAAANAAATLRVHHRRAPCATDRGVLVAAAAPLHRRPWHLYLLGLCVIGLAVYAACEFLLRWLSASTIREVLDSLPLEPPPLAAAASPPASVALRPDSLRSFVMYPEAAAAAR